MLCRALRSLVDGKGVGRLHFRVTFGKENTPKRALFYFIVSPAGADVNQSEGWANHIFSPLFMAAQEGHASVVEVREYSERVTNRKPETENIPNV
jgi:hypothetical protein